MRRERYLRGAEQCLGRGVGLSETVICKSSPKPSHGQRGEERRLLMVEEERERERGFECVRIELGKRTTIKKKMKKKQDYDVLFKARVQGAQARSLSG